MLFDFLKKKFKVEVSACRQEIVFLFLQSHLSALVWHGCVALLALCRLLLPKYNKTKNEDSTTEQTKEKAIISRACCSTLRENGAKNYTLRHLEL